MKFVMIVLDGAADAPSSALEGRTPLEAARAPNLARLAAMGRVGSVRTVPEEFEPSRDVATLSLLGYDPRAHHTGRAAFDAAAAGLELRAGDRVCRLDLVHAGPEAAQSGGRLVDASPAFLTNAEAATLLSELLTAWRASRPDLGEGVRVHHLGAQRALLIRPGAPQSPGAITTPPFSMVDEPWRENLPAGPGVEAAALRDLVCFSAVFLAGHEANLARADQGLRTANLAWAWGAASPISLPAFSEKHPLRGLILSDVDMDAAVAGLIGWGAQAAPKSAAGVIDAIGGHDLVCLRLDAADAASHRGDVAGKVAAIEQADGAYVGPILDHFLSGAAEVKALTQAPTGGDWRLLVTPAHATPCGLRRPVADAVPFLMAGSRVRSLVPRPFSEAAAGESDLHVDPGHDLMEYFLWSGRRRPRSR